ncbi:arginyltransferase [Aestuariirhabdus litorea]|uniref:Aspartate/glutamate leucyltransferase n=1 Tax=Aestuariirhabdus litorea TaxID=2528527 RepID=A0A3P3VVM5_9GAMM|nr:arginyltransferase [Aestuariirhabdus litorea]RRJ84793.1 arginyltransferase [Aestuariirhabdus litorea]RWW98016.1 arginyltransferase [Endozoicomonadaceae bacterium GTF-13]
MSNLKELRFYTTPPHNCSYLDAQQATTLFLDPEVELDNALYSQLSNFGFRRSGKHLYRPHCGECNACIPIRIPASRAVPSSSQRRILNRNRHLTCIQKPARYEEEHFQLYERYINSRHGDGDMAPPTPSQYESFLTSSWEFCHLYEFHDGDDLVAVSVTDRLEDGLSAIYTFFCPDRTKDSLGSYCILKQLEFCRQLNLPYLYLGYWIKQCKKMSYKSKYRPLELLIDNQWMELR